MSTTALDILDWVAKKTGHKLYEDENITFGEAHRTVNKAAVCWMPDAEAINRAAANGCQMLVHHEALTFPYPSFTDSRERHYLAWKTNRLRLKALSDTGITTVRIHNSADDLFIHRDFAKMLKLKGYSAKGADIHKRVHNITPTPLSRIVEQVQNATGMNGVRATSVSGQDRVIRRVAFAAGGMGLFVNIWAMADLIEQGAELIIAGETDNYAIRFCTESGVDMIETSHEVSEIPGMQSLTAALKKAFPKVSFSFLDQEPAWRMA